tara:strand:+ start:84 stop:335 length:252 start_codon:yes stop_codon:yes gene_type:complete
MNITAQGKYEIFSLYQEKTGGYPLYSKLAKQKTGLPIHHKENKELFYSLDDVIHKLKAKTHHIRLKGKDSGKQNVFSPTSIIF